MAVTIIVQPPNKVVPRHTISPPVVAMIPTPSPLPATATVYARATLLDKNQMPLDLGLSGTLTVDAVHISENQLSNADAGATVGGLDPNEKYWSFFDFNSLAVDVSGVFFLQIEVRSLSVSESTIHGSATTRSFTVGTGLGAAGRPCK